jgi:hypothetical protein
MELNLYFGLNDQDEQFKGRVSRDSLQNILIFMDRAYFSSRTGWYFSTFYERFHV